MTVFTAIARHDCIGDCMVAVAGTVPTWPWVTVDRRQWCLVLVRPSGVHSPACVEARVSPLCDHPTPPPAPIVVDILMMCHYELV